MSEDRIEGMVSGFEGYDGVGVIEETVPSRSGPVP
jgi:hypothetical protein